MIKWKDTNQDGKYAIGDAAGLRPAVLSGEKGEHK